MWYQFIGQVCSAQNARRFSTCKHSSIQPQVASLFITSSILLDKILRTSNGFWWLETDHHLELRRFDMSSREKFTVFRVTGLARDQPDEVLKASLKDTLSDHFSREERSIIQTKATIIPSCYDSDRERVALVQFYGQIPQFLSELVANPLGDWQVEMGDTDINIDCHFWGFTQLYATPENQEVKAE